MGKNIFTEYEYKSAMSSRGISGSKSHHVTAAAEQKAKNTGKLDPAVDPGVDPIRRSLLRFDPMSDGRWEVTVGCPMNIESTCDTTGSMGNNVDIAMKALPETYALVAEMLPGYDPQLALGIFGDISDNFVLCRPQFEMTADKIVDYLTKMNPERAGGDDPEDPQYAAFAAAYLTDAYTNKLGIKGYHFTITDAPCHSTISRRTLERIFGKDVWTALADNGHSDITAQQIPDIQDVYLELERRFHAFVILVVNWRCSSDFTGGWTPYYGNRIIRIRTTRDLPAVQAALVGYTEGVLQPLDVEDYLSRYDVEGRYTIVEDICRQEFAKQRKLEQAAGLHIPKVGDIFASKKDLQPISHATKTEVQELNDASDNDDASDTEDTHGNWL